MADNAIKLADVNVTKMLAGDNVTKRQHMYVECKICLRQVRSYYLKQHMKRKDHTVNLNEKLRRVRRIHDTRTFDCEFQKSNQSFS